MSDLLTSLREHDLPPKWDGRTVLWGPWRDSVNAFMCPPPRERAVCRMCGSVDRKVIAPGMVALLRGTTLDEIADYDRAHQVGSVARWRLHAFRCPNCRHDQVWDMDRRELWDLDFTDYGPDGSVDPGGRW